MHAPPPHSASPGVHSNASPRSARTRRKVRLQDPAVNDISNKAVDTFHVRISNVRGRLRVVEPRPVILTFEFDNYWYAETDVYSRDTQPVWRFNTASIRGLDGRRPSADIQTPSNHMLKTDPHSDGIDSQNPSPRFHPTSPTPLTTTSEVPSTSPTTGDTSTSAYSPVARFVYETEFGFKLHRKFFVVRLSERSPYGDVEWGSAFVPIDSIARGCEQLDLSIMAPDGVKVYGHVQCNVAMVNIQKLRVHLTDLKLSDYPEAYTYDVKLLYVDLCIRPFENGFNVATERRSDAEPRFAAHPTLERDVSLRDMIISSVSGGTSLKVCISAQRQVARDRTEEIGMGALPIRLVLKKATEGWMDTPTKFKVPLASFKGVVRGKVLLRNIPQFSQIPGTDLFNMDGVITPRDVDLSSRKLLPWVKLPRKMELSRYSPRTGRRPDITFIGETDPASSVDARSQGRGDVGYATHSRNPSACASEASDASSLADASAMALARSTQVSGDSWGAAAVGMGAVPGVSTDGEYTVRHGIAGLGLVNGSWDGNVANKSDGGYETGWRHEMIREGDDHVDGSPLPHTPVKSGKSVGSTGTAAEVGSAVLSGRSDDSVSGGGISPHSATRLGHSGDIGGSDIPDANGSRTSSNEEIDSRLGYQNSGMGRLEAATMIVHDTGGGGVMNVNANVNGESPGHETEEWIPLFHKPSKQYYFVHRDTQESLWLPPNWARSEDKDGRPYYIDHGSQSTQRAFPVDLARAYRDSFYVG